MRPHVSHQGVSHAAPVQHRHGVACRVAAVSALAISLAASAWAQQPAQGDTPVTVTRVVRQDLPEYTRGIGTVQAYRQVLVRARVDGNLDTIDFREGQEVHPGDLLAQIDPRPYAAALAQAKAKRASDQAMIDNAQRDLVRYASLVRTNVASRQQVDTQQALVAQDQASLQGDDAAIAAAALNLNYCRITSPIEGVVGLRLIDIGNLIHATDATGIVTIAQVHPISLVFTLPQDQLPAIRAAMAATGGTPPVAATKQDGGTVLSQGQLVTINNSIDQTTGTIALKAQFANTDNRLWPGQFVTGRLQLGVEHGALTLPPQAVQHGPDGLFVYTVKADSTIGRSDVKVGYQDEGAAVISSGVSAGEAVVLSGQLRVQPGMKVDARPAS